MLLSCNEKTAQCVHAALAMHMHSLIAAAVLVQPTAYCCVQDMQQQLCGQPATPALLLQCSIGCQQRAPPWYHVSSHMYSLTCHSHKATVNTVPSTHPASYAAVSGRYISLPTQSRRRLHLGHCSPCGLQFTVPANASKEQCLLTVPAVAAAALWTGSRSTWIWTGPVSCATLRSW